MAAHFYSLGFHFFGELLLSNLEMLEITYADSRIISPAPQISNYPLTEQSCKKSSSLYKMVRQITSGARQHSHDPAISAYLTGKSFGREEQKNIWGKITRYQIWFFYYTVLCLFLTNRYPMEELNSYIDKRNCD